MSHFSGTVPLVNIFGTTVSYFMKKYFTDSQTWLNICNTILSLK